MKRIKNENYMKRFYVILRFYGSRWFGIGGLFRAEEI